MVWSKKPQKRQAKKNIKKFYILNIILILCSNLLLSTPTVSTSPRGPNLIIVNLTVTPDPVVEGNIVYIRVTIQNIGLYNITAGQPIIITLKIDNEQAIAASLTDTAGLLRNQQRTENLSWIATKGTTQRRLLRITVTYLGSTEAITEREIQVNERKTDLLFVTTPSISGMAHPGTPVTIAAIIKNIGRNTTQTINVSLKIDQKLHQWHLKTGGLIKGESFGVSFSWTPLESGVHTINLTIDPKNAIAEELKSNNYYETTTSIIPWWNTSWHYRRIYNVIGKGNVSLSVNFTSLLASLQVVNKTFDNASIAVIRYYTNGSMDRVTATLFNESSKFNNRTNAQGTLLWTVPAASLFGVYFDVVENQGVRKPIPESLNLTLAGNARASILSTQGWWPEFITSFQSYYTPNTMLPIQVYTTSYAKNVTAHFSLNGNHEFDMVLQTSDNLIWNKTTQALTKRGNWTVQVVGYDDASYKTAPLTAGFYVGQPDLSVSALSMPTVGYIGYNITVIANIRAVNTTVQQVNVSLYVDNIINATQRNLTILKDENRTLQFTWKPKTKGQHNISVRIDFIDSNPTNNRRWKLITVETVPDLAVLNISVSPVPVEEGDPVTVTAYINNTGDGNATDYEIILYCEQNVYNNTMYYFEEKNSTKFSLKKNERKNVTLIWEKTEYGKTSFRGEWAVGIQIRNTTLTPDKNGANNYRALFHVLRVNPGERKPPLLSNLEYPTNLEQGNPVLIRVRATDDSGIDTVTIVLKTPNKTFVNDSMSRKESDRFEYSFTPSQLGKHDFVIKATDLSPSKNQSTITGSFEITEDKTPPTITYFGVNPFVQQPDDRVEIRCITTDPSGISSVEVTIWLPDDRSESHQMTNTPPDTKYQYFKTSDDEGRYRFVITVQDTKGNKKTTEVKSFWIAKDLNDTDSDGMPDTWEVLYGFNPYEPDDALLDWDNDGINNLREYQQGTNPLKEVSSPSEILERFEQNLAYLIASVLVCISIVVLAWYGIRRRRA